ncbi:dopamine beta-hydroxylase-like isoform X1 [Mytilus edulis]|uniref:dopamine beta-hydroxylase-like isoform X1 n=2 Tax=Mytilus edulis TaxID=6550 RepID=UPI0039EEAC73
MHIISIVLLFSSCYKCFGYYQFQAFIPNGLNVKDPCDATQIWKGVGHMGPLGSGPRNSFGEDFKLNGFKWTTDLCWKDSDQDGRYNGYELGDPWCLWTPGSKQPLYPPLSHPGICEPWDSETCQSRNGSLQCNNEMPACDGINGTDVKNVTLRLPLSYVPARRVSYVCSLFSLPSDAEYHVIAALPIKDNSQILHGITVFGCDPRRQFNRTDRAYLCNGIPTTPCQEIITGYTAGVPQTCMPAEAGVRIGIKGFRQVMVAFQYYNPTRRQGYTDSSGMTLYYTPKLRRFDAGVSPLEVTHFSVPPGRESFEVVSACPGDCTVLQVASPIYIVLGMNHMHRLGRKQKIEIHRGGKLQQIVTNDTNYKVVHPHYFWYKQPIQLLPGDMLKMTCEYNSTSENDTVEWDVSWRGEMCKGLLLYYPKQSWPSHHCQNYRSVPLCEIMIDAPVFGCHFRSFISNLATTNRTLVDTVIRNCGQDKSCSPLCLRMIGKVRQDPCLQGDIYDLWKETRLVKANTQLMALYDVLTKCEEFYKGLVPDTIFSDIGTVLT